MKKSSEHLRDSFVTSLLLCLMISFIFSGIFFFYNKKSTLKRENLKIKAKLDYHMDDLVGSYTLENQKALQMQIEYLFQDTPVNCIMFNKGNQSVYIKGSPGTCSNDLSFLDISSGGLSIGKIYYHIDLTNIDSKLYVIPLILVIVFTSLMLVSVVNFRSIVSSLINPLSKLITSLNSIEQLEEFKTGNLELNVLKEKIIENQLMIQESASKEVYNNLAKQVAHDIKSPLTALDMIVSDLSEVDKEKIVLIKNSVQRIKDISNNLYSSSLERTDSVKKTLIVNLTEEIISEKRINFKNYEDLEINLSVDNSCYNLFVDVIPTELKRVLSNIIDNAIQACSCRKGLVEISLSRLSNNVKISIADNGIGVSKENIKKIFENGFTTKFNSGGKGLGLFHAKATLESFNGNISLNTKSDKTIFDIFIPIANAPEWFCGEISINAGRVIVVDDDKSIQQLWNTKLNHFKVEKLFFSSPHDFLDFPVNKDDLILVDYEYIGSILNGLDIIERKKLNNTFLVTSHFDEEYIQNKATQLGVRIIPKNILPYLELKNTHFKRVLIDDDKLVQMTWKMEAKKKNIDLEVYSTFEDFYNVIDHYDSSIRLYIDSELGNVKGEEKALELYNQNFKDIHLVTGHDSSNFREMYWLRTINDKSPCIL